MTCNRCHFVIYNDCHNVTSRQVAYFLKYVMSWHVTIFFFPTQELLKHSQYELLLAGHSAVFSPHLNLLGPSAGVSLSCRASPKSGAWSFHACILPAGSPNSVAANAD